MNLDKQLNDILCDLNPAGFMATIRHHCGPWERDAGNLPWIPRADTATFTRAALS
jgi:hypothetical protein